MNPSIEELECLYIKAYHICEECTEELGYWSMVHCQDCFDVYVFVYIWDCLEEMGYSLLEYSESR